MTLNKFATENVNPASQSIEASMSKHRTLKTHFFSIKRGGISKSEKFAKANIGTTISSDENLYFSNDTQSKSTDKGQSNPHNNSNAGDKSSNQDQNNNGSRNDERYSNKDNRGNPRDSTTYEVGKGLAAAILSGATGGYVGTKTAEHIARKREEKQTPPGRNT